MSWNGKSLVGIALLLLGAWVVLSMIGIHIGGVISFLLGLVFTYYGIRKSKAGQKGLGIIMLILGLILLVSSLPFLVSLIFAGICIYFGWKLIRKNEGYSKPAPACGSANGDDFKSYTDVKVENNFESEWKDFLKKREE